MSTTRLPTFLHWTPPFLVHVAGNLLFWIAAYRHGLDWLEPTSRARSDTFRYLSIAQHGYRVEHCPTAGPGLPDTCGNIGWFPLYPLVLRPVHDLLDMEWVVAGVLVAEVCLLGALVLLWHLLGARVTADGVACLVLAACWPGAVFYHAAFPIALSVFLALVAWSALERGWWAPAGIAGLLATMACGITVLIAPAMLAYLFLNRSRDWLRRAAVVCGLPVLGVVATAGLIWYDTDRATAFPDYHRRWFARLHNPVTSYREILHTTVAPGTGGDPWPVPKVLTTVGWEMHAALALLVAAALVVGVEAVRRNATALDTALVLYGFLIFTVPLVVAPHLMQARFHALMMPMVLVFRRLPAMVSGPVAAAAVPLAYGLGVLFVVSSLG